MQHCQKYDGKIRLLAHSENRRFNAVRNSFLEAASGRKCLVSRFR